MPWGMPDTQWFRLKPPSLSILSIFQLLKKKILLQTTVNIWNWSQLPDFHYCWAKNCMGIPWGMPEIPWFCLKQLKTTYSEHFENFPATEKFRKQILLQTTANMCETDHNNLTYITVEQKLHGNTLRHAWDTVILLKTAYFKHFEDFPAIENFIKTNFAVNRCEYVWNWSQ